MTFGQPDSIAKQANAAVQSNQCDNYVIGGAPAGQVLQANFSGSSGCDGSCGQAMNGQGCGCENGGGAVGGCNGCGAGNCNGRCGLRNRLGGRSGGQKMCCPGCSASHLPQEFCQLEVKQGETEKTCYEVGYKTICIPKIVPPWKKDCCTPQCAEARSVKVLKKRKYKCPSCKYSWKVVKPELPAAPGMMPAAPNAPTQNDYYNTTPVHGGTSVEGMAPITPSQPQPPAVGQYFGNSTQQQLWQKRTQQQNPGTANLHQQQLIQQRQALQQQQQMIQQQAQQQQARQAKAKEASGSLGDYYR